MYGKVCAALALLLLLPAGLAVEVCGNVTCGPDQRCVVTDGVPTCVPAALPAQRALFNPGEEPFLSSGTAVIAGLAVLGLAALAVAFTRRT